MQFLSKVHISLFFMSRFDPFDVYSHRQKYSHEGQILRKKPIKTEYAISGEMVKEAKRVLEAVGLYSNVSPAPPTPQTTQLNGLLCPTYTAYSISITGQNNFNMARLYSDQSGIRQAFSNVLDHEGTLINFHVTIILNSLSFYDSAVMGSGGSFTLTTPTLNSTVNIPSGSSERFYATWLPMTTQSFLLVTYDFPQGHSYTTPDSGLLSRITSESTAAYNALKSGDFTNWNPVLFQLTVSPISAFEIFSYNLTINMVAEYS